MTAFCTAGVAPIVPLSPMPFDAEVVERRRRLGVHGLEAGQLGGRDDAVVGEVRRERVAVVVVDDLFEQRLRDALREPTVHLTLGEQRVEDAPGVVDRDELAEHDLAGLDVDLDDGEVGARRERAAAWAKSPSPASGLAADSAATVATSTQERLIAGVPATWNRPSSSTTSATSASSRRAAMSRA